MHLHEIQQRLETLGAKPGHAARVWRAWLGAGSLDKRHSPAASYLPLRLREALPALWQDLDALARIHTETQGADDSTRLLLKLADGQTVESVLLPRDGLCVSTQVGCAVGCRFCMTGRAGLLRQLSSGEIAAQVALARRQRTVRKVVFMGMGEPAHNIDAVLEAITWLCTHGGVGHKNLVFSTVGDPRVFERLPKETVKPALALSLHTTNAELRTELLPKAPRMTPEELVEAGEHYARLTGYPIQYQWTLIAGVNDSDAELDGIVHLLSGKYAMMNFIPFNRVEGLNYQRPAPERATQMANHLRQHGIHSTLRQSAGQDIDGACGQLRARQWAAEK